MKPPRFRARKSCWKSWLFLLFSAWAAAPAAQAGEAARVSFYFCAHPDDCVLFMNPELSRDILTPETKVVAFYLTAGDAGEPLTAHHGQPPYYVARREAAMLSTRFLADSDQPDAEADTLAPRNGVHSVQMYKNTVSYFLDLPDGIPESDGSAATHFETLKKLREGLIHTISAVDGTRRYHGWEGLSASLRELIEQETPAGAAREIHIADEDLTHNPGDHPDHRHTALLALDAIHGGGCFRVVRHVGYAVAEKPENLAREALLSQVGAYAIISAIRSRNLFSSAWDHTHRAFLGRGYSRSESVGCEAP